MGSVINWWPVQGVFQPVIPGNGPSVESFMCGIIWDQLWSCVFCRKHSPNLAVSLGWIFLKMKQCCFNICTELQYMSDSCSDICRVYLSVTGSLKFTRMSNSVPALHSDPLMDSKSTYIIMWLCWYQRGRKSQKIKASLSPECLSSAQLYCERLFERWGIKSTEKQSKAAVVSPQQQEFSLLNGCRFSFVLLMWLLKKKKSAWHRCL